MYAKLEEKESADHLFVRLVHRPECVVSSRPVLNVSALVNLLVYRALGSVRQIISASSTHNFINSFNLYNYLFYLGVEAGDESNCITTSNYYKLE